MIDPQYFSEAVWSGEVSTVQAPIVAGADVNAADALRDPPLHLAIEQQWIEIVRHLIKAGAEINRDLGDGWTPLVHAIDVESDGAWQTRHESGHQSTELTEILLAAGAIPTERAFEVAHNYGNHKALNLLRSSTEST